jgi:uncharacterized membrane protein
MEFSVSLLIWVGFVLLVGLLMLVLPRAARPGLLFGVYVGNEAAAGDPARRIRRSWYRGMVAVITLGLAVGIGLGVQHELAAAPANVLALLLLMAGFRICYVRAYRMARKLAPAEPPPAAVAALAPIGPGRWLPASTLVLSVVVAVFTVGYAWRQYHLLPERTPMHFSAADAPDAWKQRSLGQVMWGPSLTLLMAVTLGSLAFPLARAKRTVRAEDGPCSFRAQQRFRTLTLRIYCGAVLLLTMYLATNALESMEIEVGHAPPLAYVRGILGAVVVLYCLGGVAYVALGIGQGGARLEAPAAAAPLTDGLADNTKWKLGLFYVNRDDPSLVVEKRFGIGYTINLGNPKAVTALVLFLVLVLGMPVLLIIAG